MDNNRDNRIPTEDGRFVRPALPDERHEMDLPRQDDPFRKAEPVPDARRPEVHKPDMKRLMDRMSRANPEMANPAQAKRYGLGSGSC